MTKFSNKLKNPWFWPILGPFFAILGQKNFSQKALSPTTSNEYLALCQISEKTNDTIPRKCLDRRMEGSTDPILQDPSSYCRGSKNLLTWRHTDGKKNKEKNFKKPTLSLVNAGPPDRVSVLSTECGGCHPKGLIVASSHKIEEIIILKLFYAKADSPFS